MPDLMERISDFFTDLFFDPDSKNGQEKLAKLEVEVKELPPEFRKVLESRLLKIRYFMHFTKSIAEENPEFVDSIFSTSPIRSTLRL